MIIDGYTHFSPRRHLLELSKYPDVEMSQLAKRILKLVSVHLQFEDREARLQDLDRYRIGMEITMINHQEEPNSFPIPERDLLKMCQTINDDCSRLQAESDGRIFVMGSVPLMAQKDETIQEMRRCVNELGLKGFMVLSNVQGKPIDSFEYFWEEAERLGAVTYIHPFDSGTQQTRPYEYDYDLMHIFGWPYETTVMLSRLIFSGIMDKYPNLKIVSHHMGGMIPFFMGRVSETYALVRRPTKNPEQITEARAPVEQSEQNMKKQAEGNPAVTTADLYLPKADFQKPVFDYFKMFYYDTALGGSVAATRCGYEVFGAERIVFGTDYPWGPNGGRARLEGYPRVIREAVPDASAQQKIFEDNIRKLMKI